MYRSPLLLAMLLAQLSTVFSQTDGDLLFDRSYLHEIRFESSDTAFFYHLDSVWFQGLIDNDYNYLPCKVTIDGNLVDSIGLRIKGGLSAFDPKRPLKIDFNEYVPGQSYDGVKVLNLHNGNLDPSMQRECISYEILRGAGLKCARTAFAQVWINDDLQGVYTLTEQVDKNFLRNYFADDEGTLYKNKICELEVESGDSTFSYYDAMMATTAITDDSAFTAAIEPLLATEDFLRFFLTEVFLNAIDNPLSAGCNFYLYHEPKSGLLYWIPWDFNIALYPGADFKLIPDYTVNAVLKRMIQVPAYRERYLELACEFLEFVFTEENIHPKLEANAALLRDAVAVDTLSEFTLAEFDDDLPLLKDVITGRINRFENDLAELMVACQPFQSPASFHDLVINEFMASTDSLGGNADPAGEYPDWIEIYNNAADTLPLEHCYLSNDRDFLKHWRFPPGSSIGPGEYLIVWADRDVEQPGLHTDFKLDAAGGELFLIFEDFTVLDSLSYGPQSTNIASARVPNGTGSFVQQAATFGADNGPSNSNEPRKQAVEASIYPNPASSVVAIQIMGETAGFHLKISSAIGQLFLEKNIIGNSFDLPLSGWPAGVYFVEISTDTGKWVGRLVRDEK